MISKSYWHKVANSYDNLVGKTGDKAHSMVINPFVFKFLGNLKGKKVLDGGCGNGYLAYEMSKIAKDVVGVDFTEELIKRAKRMFQRKNLNFKIGNLEKLSFKNEEFDIVLCNMVLIDCENLDKVMKELGRVLKQNGISVISITHPCFENPPNTLTLKDSKAEKIGRLVKHYFKTGLVKDEKINWDTKCNYQHYHYKISDYLNTFSKNQLFIEKTTEPNWVEMTGEGGYSHAPYFIIWKLRKINC